MGDGVHTEINRRTTTVTVPTAIAAATLSLRVWLRFSSQLLSQDDNGGYFPQCLLPQAARHGQALRHLSGHNSQRYLPGRAAEDGQERRVAATDRRPDSACIALPHRGSTQSECGFPFSMWCSVPFCLTLHHKTSRPSWVSSSMSTSPSASSRVSTTVLSTMSTSPCASSWVSEESDVTVLCTEAAPSPHLRSRGQIWRSHLQINSQQQQQPTTKNTLNSTLKIAISTTTETTTTTTQHLQRQLPQGQRGRQRHVQQPKHLGTFWPRSADMLHTDSPSATSTATLSTIGTTATMPNHKGTDRYVLAPQCRHVAHRLAVSHVNRNTQHDRDNRNHAQPQGTDNNKSGAATARQTQLHKQARKTKSSLNWGRGGLPSGWNARSVDEELSSSLCRLATHRAHARSFLALLLLLGQPRLPVLHQPLSASMSTRCPLHGSRRRVSVFSCIAEIWSHHGLLFGCCSQILPMRHLDCWAAPL